MEMSVKQYLNDANTRQNGQILYYQMCLTKFCYSISKRHFVDYRFKI